jgi:hypothetical protein
MSFSNDRTAIRKLRTVTAYLLILFISVICLADWSAADDVRDRGAPVEGVPATCVSTLASSRQPGKEDVAYTHHRRSASRTSRQRQHLPPYVAPHVLPAYYLDCPLRRVERPLLLVAYAPHFAPLTHPDFRAPPLSRVSQLS